MVGRRIFGLSSTNINTYLLKQSYNTLYSGSPHACLAACYPRRKLSWMICEKQKDGNKWNRMRIKSGIWNIRVLWNWRQAVLAVSLDFPMALWQKHGILKWQLCRCFKVRLLRGAVAKGITVTKYQNRANKENGIDWGKVWTQMALVLPWSRIGYYKDRIRILNGI